MAASGETPVLTTRGGSAVSRSMYDNRLKRLETQQSTWRPHWQDLADHFTPRRQRLLSHQRSRGSKMNQRIINNTGTRALNMLAGNMVGYITSPNRIWFELLHPEAEMNDLAAVKRWLTTTEDRMRLIMLRSNFYRALASLYKDLCLFETGCFYIEGDDQDIIRAHVFPIGSYYLASDMAGRIDTVFRVMELTVRQIVQRFASERLVDEEVQAATNISTNVKRCWQSRNWDELFKVVHVIEPNHGRMLYRQDAAGMPWRDLWYEHDAREPEFLRIGGYRERPFMAVRWDTTGEDEYGGDGPGMMALGDVRQLQRTEKLWLKALDKIVDPPMTAASTMRTQRTSLLPGDVTYIGHNEKFQPAHEVDAKALAMREEIPRIEQRINSAFYADLFLMMASLQRPEITATEANIRNEEKLLTLGPVLEGLEDDLLDPCIDRVFERMEWNGILSEVPEELKGVALRVQHVSFMARAQKVVSTGGVQQLVAMAQALAGAPVHDKLDDDRVMTDYADLLGTDPSLLRSDDEVDELRRERQRQQIYALQSAQAANQAAGAAKQLGETNINGRSALDALAGAAGGAIGGPQDAAA